MAFTPTDLTYTTEYAKALANQYPYLSYFSDIYGANANSATYKPVAGKSIVVQSMTVSGAKAVDRDNLTGAFTRNFNTDDQVLTMSMDREWSTLVDPMDMQEDAVVNLANITQTFNAFQKVPEQDAYAASAIAAVTTETGNTDNTTLTAANILEKWDEYVATLVDARVPRNRIECKVTPTVYKLLKEATGITRFIDTNSERSGYVDRNVAYLDGIRITEVPSDLMKSAYTFTEGWQAASGASQINMLLYDPLAIAAPIVYDTSMMSAPTAQSKGKWLYYERYYYDVFVLEQRQAGVYANIA